MVSWDVQTVYRFALDPYYEISVRPGPDFNFYFVCAREKDSMWEFPIAVLTSFKPQEGSKNED